LKWSKAQQRETQARVAGFSEFEGNAKYAFATGKFRVADLPVRKTDVPRIPISYGRFFVTSIVSDKMRPIDGK
jgi:hypothetical protein